MCNKCACVFVVINIWQRILTPKEFKIKTNKKMYYTDRCLLFIVIKYFSNIQKPKGKSLKKLIVKITLKNAFLSSR